MNDNQFGFAHLWAQGDVFSHLVAILLAVMSIASWTLIILKTLQSLRLRRAANSVEGFWNSPRQQDGLRHLAAQGGDNSPFFALARAGIEGAECYDQQNTAQSVAGRLPRDEFITHVIRQSIARTTHQLESGLTILASVGSTAPFIGLFGTVWGIYHALLNIGMSGQATLDKVAGPVGEALIMTAFGLAVAIPAVLAYNMAVRSNRNLLGELDAFAHDLHVFLAAGVRMPQERKGA